MFTKSSLMDIILCILNGLIPGLGSLDHMLQSLSVFIFSCTVRIEQMTGIRNKGTLGKYSLYLLFTV